LCIAVAIALELMGQTSAATSFGRDGVVARPMGGALALALKNYFRRREPGKKMIERYADHDVRERRERRSMDASTRPAAASGESAAQPRAGHRGGKSRQSDFRKRRGRLPAPAGLSS
jgi:hypothetical protein